MGCMACNQHGREVLKRKTCPALTLWLSAYSPNVHVGERKLHNLQRMWFLSLDVWSRVAGNHDDNQSSFFYVALSQNFANGCIDQSYASIPLVGWYRWRNLSRFRAPPKCGQVDHWPFEWSFDLLLALHCGSCHDPKLSTADLVFARQRLWFHYEVFWSQHGGIHFDGIVQAVFDPFPTIGVSSEVPHKNSKPKRQGLKGRSPKSSESQCEQSRSNFRPLITPVMVFVHHWPQGVARATSQQWQRHDIL